MFSNVLTNYKPVIFSIIAFIVLYCIFGMLYQVDFLTAFGTIIVSGVSWGVYMLTLSVEE